MRIRGVVGVVLLSLSSLAVVQTAREAWQELGTPWTSTPMSDTAFTFSGRSIVIKRPPRVDAGPRPALVPQERVLIDGVAVGAATGLRMATWPYQGDRRSPHWLDAEKFVHRAGRDSSVWLARRLQVADSVPPRFEIIAVEANGQTSVHVYGQSEVRGEYRRGTVTALIAEDPRPEFPFSVVGLLWVPYLLLVFPIGTGIVGVVLLRSARSARVTG